MFIFFIFVTYLYMLGNTEFCRSIWHIVSGNVRLLQFLDLPPITVFKYLHFVREKGTEKKYVTFSFHNHNILQLYLKNKWPVLSRPQKKHIRRISSTYSYVQCCGFQCSPQQKTQKKGSDFRTQSKSRPRRRLLHKGGFTQ